MNTKSLVQAVAIAVALTAPIASFAQSAQPLTRAQVREELMELEATGYDPVADEIQYPANLHAAETVLAARKNDSALASAEQTGFGTSAAGSSQSGAAARPAQASQDMYFGR